jgi:hypothetical protein
MQRLPDDLQHNRIGSKRAASRKPRHDRVDVWQTGVRILQTIFPSVWPAVRGERTGQIGVRHTGNRESDRLATKPLGKPIAKRRNRTGYVLRLIHDVFICRTDFISQSADY